MRIHTFSRASARKGFSLTELAIVLAVVAVIVGAAMQYAGSFRQKARVDSVQKTISALVDSTRAAYGSQAAITGTIKAMVPAMVQAQAVPPDLIRPNTTTCGGITSNFLDSAWPGTADACGNLRLCAWNYGSDSACGTGAASPYFAIELVNLDYAGCTRIVMSIQPSQPAGLKDIYINGTSIFALSPTYASDIVATNCQKTLTNKVDFVYLLRVSGT